jgi:hypothetical protein
MFPEKSHLHSGSEELVPMVSILRPGEGALRQELTMPDIAKPSTFLRIPLSKEAR